MAVLLATLSALTFGTGDFLGGLSSKRMAAAITTVTAQLVGLVLILGVCLVVSGDPNAHDLWMGVFAGLGGGLGLTFFYWAMSIGPMSVIAPVSALLNALVPVLAGFIKGERPTPLALVGIVLAVPAILLISRELTDDEVELAHPHADPTTEPGAPRGGSSTGKVQAANRRPLPEQRRSLGTWFDRIGGLPVIAGAFAGICFGFFFVFLNETSDGSGLWPIVTARAAAVVLGSATALLTKVSMPTKVGVLLASTAGCLDVVGNSLYLLATRHGLIILVGVVSAMYPASTIVLARYVLHERMARHQAIGLAVAALTVALIAVAG